MLVLLLRKDAELVQELLRLLNLRNCEKLAVGIRAVKPLKVDWLTDFAYPRRGILVTNLVNTLNEWRQVILTIRLVVDRIEFFR